VDPSTFPVITVQQDVADWNHELVGAGAQEVLLTLAENLELENQAVLRHDAGILVAACHGDRLAEMQARVADAATAGRSMVTRYHFDTLELELREPFGVQAGLSLGLISRGTKTEVTYDAAGTRLSSVDSPFDLTFVMARPTSYRWLTVAVEPAGT
jgi:hypothetical protein